MLTWKSDNQLVPENLKYGRAGFPAEAVRCALLQQQHYLCAYTLIRLKKPEECNVNNKTRESCHIEHILPQTRGELVEKKRNGEKVKEVVNFIPGEDIDFHNMVACYPPSIDKIYCDYGAQYKGDYDPYDNQLFLSPLLTPVELHFKFFADGRVEAETERGKETIQALQLDHNTLRHLRKKTITGAIYPRGIKGGYISAAEARRLATEVLQPAPDGRLREFCIAIHHAALRHASKLEQRAKRKSTQQRD